MRGLDTSIRKIRRQVFTEIAKLAFSSSDLHDIEKIPYLISPGDVPHYRDSIHTERAIASERLRLAMGMSLRPQNMPVHITDGIEESNIAEKYYEPPLLQVIPSACNACQKHTITVSDQCEGCTAHPCTEVCPKNAISIVNGRSFIDQNKCIRCGRCKSVCGYHAIVEKKRPCEESCGVGAIESDDLGRAKINPDKCVSCGMCMASCPFGAIADKSQIFQLIRALQTGRKIIAEIAPAFVGQFGDDATPEKIKAALIDIGFDDVYEVAIGADLGALAEAHHYCEKVVTGELPFLLTSCCPSWSMLAKKMFPELIDNVSNELTPMVATARIIKEKYPDACVVFIGPCVSKKLEALRKDVRSDVDFVITFEELAGIFDAKEIDFSKIQTTKPMQDASSAGRGYGASGGVADAIEKCIEKYYPDTVVYKDNVEGLAECKKTLILAKAGKKNGCLIEGMACPGGCIAGAGTNITINKAQIELKKFAQSAKLELPKKE